MPEIRHQWQQEEVVLALRTVQNLLGHEDIVLSLALDTFPQRGAKLLQQQRAILAIA